MEQKEKTLKKKKEEKKKQKIKARDKPICGMH
jgi:hypothetical protein